MEELYFSAPVSVQRPDLVVNHQHLKINQQSQLVLTQAHSRDKTSLVSDFHPEGRKAVLHFIMNGETRFSQRGLVPPAHLNGDKCSLMIMQPNPTRQSALVWGDFMMASFYLDLEWFISLLGTASEALPAGFRKSVWKNNCSCNNFSWSPEAYSTLLNVLLCDPVHRNDPCFLEGKMMDLVVVILRGTGCDYAEQNTIPWRETDKLYFVRQWLNSHLHESPSIRDLARLAGTNEFGLKKGFRQLFGKTIYQFLYQRRMEKAMELLVASDLSVATIGALVGYGNPSAFSRAFALYFRKKPTQIRSKFH